MTSIHLTLSDYVIVVGYLVVVVLVGAWFRNRVRNARDYFAGGQQIPWWMAGISHYMSSFSAFSFIAYSQLGYTYGWVAVTLFWVTIPGCLAGGSLFREVLAARARYHADPVPGRTVQRLCAAVLCVGRNPDEDLRRCPEGLLPPGCLYRSPAA